MPRSEAHDEGDDRLIDDLADAPDWIEEDEIDNFVEQGGTLRSPPRRELTERELMTLRLLSRGLTVKMVAETLHLSPATITERMKTVRYQLRAKNITNACCEALRRHLID